MAAGGPDLYESLEIRYPPSAPRAPGTPPRLSHSGPVLAVGAGVLLVLGTALATLVTLHVQGQAELRAARAQLAAARDPLLPDPDGLWSPGDSAAAAQRRQDQLGRWLQGLALGWRYRGGRIYFFSGEPKAWGDAEAACRAMRGHLASVTSAEEQDYLAQEARGGSYWIGLVATGPGGSWRWVDGTPYDPAQSFWARGQPDGTDHGHWGGEGCAQLLPGARGRWNDHNCNFSFPWLCERGLGPP